MTTFKTKTRAIILSTLLMCSKYSSIDNKITFFEPVYANDSKQIAVLQELHDNHLKNVNQLRRTRKKLYSQDCTTAINSLRHIGDSLQQFIDPSQIAILKKQMATKESTDTPTLTLLKNINNNFRKLLDLSNSNKTNTRKKEEELKKEIYQLAGRIQQKLERKYHNGSYTSTPASTAVYQPLVSLNTSTHVSNTSSGPTNSQNSNTASISTNEPQSSKQHTLATPPESPTIKHNTQSEEATRNSNNGNTEDSDDESNTSGHNSDNDSIADSEYSEYSEYSEDEDDKSGHNNDNGSSNDNKGSGEQESVAVNTDFPSTEASTIVSSNESDKQPQSSDSGIQSTTEDDDVGVDDNNDNFIQSSPPLQNNNTAMLSNSDDSNHDHLTPISRSVAKGRTLVFPQISRKVSSDRTRPKGASFSSNLQRLKRYELETKYLYSTTTTPQKNGNSKSNIHGLLVNLKRQITSQFTAGVFYSPTSNNTTFIDKVNNSSTNINSSGYIDHLLGVYTSYSITPVTYLSNQIAFGTTTTDNNKSSTKKYSEYLMVDSFISHKINLDTTKIISPELGISYYQSSAYIPYDIGYINNLSLNIGMKFQYKYQYSNFELCPSVKISHVHPLYTNITAHVIDLSNRANALPVNLLRDLQSAFDPHSSIRFALSVRHNRIRLESGYGFTTYHNVEHSYTHTFFAKLNLAL